MLPGRKEAKGRARHLPAFRQQALALPEGLGRLLEQGRPQEVGGKGMAHLQKLDLLLVQTGCRPQVAGPFHVIHVPVSFFDFLDDQPMPGVDFVHQP